MTDQPTPLSEEEERLDDWVLSDIADRDAQTEPVAVAAQLPLGRSGTKYDHARRQTSDYHLDTDELALGDRHLLLREVKRLRAHPATPGDLSDGVALIAAERQRQIEVEGYDADHDADNADELARAAACYALPESHRSIKDDEVQGRRVPMTLTLRIGLWRHLWPWQERYWKPTPDNRRRELVKAGALIAAAIDSLNEENR